MGEDTTTRWQALERELAHEAAQHAASRQADVRPAVQSVQAQHRERKHWARVGVQRAEEIYAILERAALDQLGPEDPVDTEGRRPWVLQMGRLLAERARWGKEHEHAFRDFAFDRDRCLTLRRAFSAHTKQPVFTPGEVEVWHQWHDQATQQLADRRQRVEALRHTVLELDRQINATVAALCLQWGVDLELLRRLG